MNPYNPLGHIPGYHLPGTLTPEAIAVAHGRLLAANPPIRPQPTPEQMRADREHRDRAEAERVAAIARHAAAVLQHEAAAGWASKQREVATLDRRIRALPASNATSGASYAVAAWSLILGIGGIGTFVTSGGIGWALIGIPFLILPIRAAVMPIRVARRDALIRRRNLLLTARGCGEASCRACRD